MPTIQRSRQSVCDYEEIWSYVAQDDVNAADRLITTFENKLALIATMPEMGKDESDLAPNLRSFPIGSYLLYYRPSENGIQLVRALHGARDITAEYFDE